MKLTPHSSRITSGFSLIELLICVGLIGMITALVIPFYSSSDGAREAKDKRNAQTLCSICAVAEASGISVVNDDSIKMEVLQALIDGVKVEDGPLRGRTLSVPNMNQADLDSAARYLEINNGALVYNAALVSEED